MDTSNRREVTQRATAIGLATLMTWSLLGSINSLAVEPAPGSLLGGVSNSRRRLGLP